MFVGPVVVYFAVIAAVMAWEWVDEQPAARAFLSMAALQFTQYIVLTVNFRAIAHARYLTAGGTAAFAAFLAYTIVRRVVKDESRWGLLGMVCGGSIADMAGIWLTRAWK